MILFLGDGMSVTTLTAARILKGQLEGRSGEEGSLFFEKFPNVALVKVTVRHNYTLGTHYVITCTLTCTDLQYRQASARLSGHCNGFSMRSEGQLRDTRCDGGNQDK